MESNELKIDLYPGKKARYNFPKTSVESLITKDTLGHSLNKDQQLAFIRTNVPLLNGFYTAHNNHYPIRIKPDDIWLLIVQGFSNHVNANAEELRKLFVDFDGKKEQNYEEEEEEENSEEKLSNKNSFFDTNELKIELYPKNLPKKNLEKQSIKNILPKGTLSHSLDENKDLAFLGSNVSLLEGFYTSHYYHYPIRIKPDDIWLLIVQSFSHHVNANSEKLRNYFVNFDR
jgi:hypothetical protein